MNPTEIVLVAALVLWVLYRQVAGRFVRPADAAWRVPLILTAVGLIVLARSHPVLSALTVGVTAADLLVAAGLGAARGAVVTLETRDGFLYQRGGVPMVVMWLVTIAVRVGIGFGAAAVAPGAMVTDGLLLSIGLSLLVQAAVLNRRVAADGRPVRPDSGRRGRATRATL